MRSELTPILQCPACSGERPLTLDVVRRDALETREGTLRCPACGAAYTVERGIAMLLHEPFRNVLEEAAGLERFAARMREQGWDGERIKQLPDVDLDYWWVQGRSMIQLEELIDFQPGERLLDVGSNTCWASARFAGLGLDVVALDISTTDLQGLDTARYFLDEGIYFERVLASMRELPFAAGQFDYVFCCQVLHHNDRRELRRTFAEIYRVLRPGGRLLMVNETLRTLRSPGPASVPEDVVEFEGNEHSHWALGYRREARRAGFATETLDPWYRPFFFDPDVVPRGGSMPLLGPLLRRAVRRSRDIAVVRGAYRAWLNNVWGGVSMNMIATKPSHQESTGAPSGPAPARR